MLKMAEAETLGPNIADEGGVEKDQRQRGNPSEVTDSNEDQTKDALADQRDAVEENNQPKGRVDDSVNDANKEGEKTHLHLCEQCETGTKKVDLCGDNEDSEQHNQADIVRTAGSGCSSPASSTAGVDHDLRLPVGSPGAWPPGGYPVHYVADSPLTPTRFRSKSEADTSTNPVHAQPVVGGASSVRPKERRAHSTSSAVSPNSTSSSSTAESPRGEPAGSASGSLSLHGSSTGSSACHTPSSSHSRTPSLSPSGISASAIPPVDPTALADIEKHSKRVADSVELMMGHLSSTLQNMSAITVGHTQTYRDAVDKAGVTVDQSVKCMYALIARCEELNKTMEPVHRLANQIKSIKRLLEEMESVCK
ncbi:uncharacterized protein LOC110974085 isoform X2 [Acanthaster planci]|uniref:Uncharacterized protein LOC110974085 isoform X2 n=1 Tax=Acanthaster planci TaxID=133434 RepID=A0A8B7XLV0_ACAPL|nr:uncharacterized protein LOC110974085 isoform X2 [Acanthaster planci]